MKPPIMIFDAITTSQRQNYIDDLLVWNYGSKARSLGDQLRRSGLRVERWQEVHLLASALPS